MEGGGGKQFPQPHWEQQLIFASKCKGKSPFWPISQRAVINFGSPPPPPPDPYGVLGRAEGRYGVWPQVLFGLFGLMCQSVNSPKKRMRSSVACENWYFAVIHVTAASARTLNREGNYIMVELMAPQQSQLCRIIRWTGVLHQKTSTAAATPQFETDAELGW